MSIVFPDSHVDLMGTVTFTRAQLIQRWDRELARKWSRPVQDNLRDFMMVKDSLDPETFPDFDANLAYLQEFTADKQICYSRRMADEAKNQLLIDAIAYEQALRRKAELELLINGREAVAETLEERDPVTHEITQEYIAPLEAIEPLAQTIEQDGEEVGNPAYQAAVAELAECQVVIDGAGQDVVDLASSRPTGF